MTRPRTAPPNLEPPLPRGDGSPNRPGMTRSPPPGSLLRPEDAHPPPRAVIDIDHAALV